MEREKTRTEVSCLGVEGNPQRIIPGKTHADRAQFHGSAYRKHRISTYGSREFCANCKRISLLKRRILASVRAYSTLLGILRLQGKRRNSALARKWGIVIVSAEFGGKQSHVTGLSCVYG